MVIKRSLQHNNQADNQANHTLDGENPKANTPVQYNIPENPTAARRERLARLLTKPFYMQFRSRRLKHNDPENPKDSSKSCQL